MTGRQSDAIVLAVLDRLTGMTKDEIGLVSGVDVGEIELSLDRLVTRGEVVRVVDKAARKGNQTVHRVWLTRDCPIVRKRIEAQARAYRRPPSRQAELLQVWMAGEV